MVLEMEGEICSLDPSVSRVRQQVYLLQKEENFVIYKENCNCVEGMMKAHLIMMVLHVNIKSMYMSGAL